MFPILCLSFQSPRSQFNNQFRFCCNAQLLVDNNLSETFSENVHYYCSNAAILLKRVKTFLRITLIQERLNTLSMLSLEKKLMTQMTEFNLFQLQRKASQVFNSNKRSSNCTRHADVPKFIFEICIKYTLMFFFLTCEGTHRLFDICQVNMLFKNKKDLITSHHWYAALRTCY